MAKYKQSYYGVDFAGNGSLISSCEKFLLQPGQQSDIEDREA
jgi:hypothetical protein